MGNASDIVNYFSSKPVHELILIAAHGDERGLLLPDLGESIKGHYPFVDVIRPEDFRTFLALQQNIVLSTGCRVAGLRNSEKPSWVAVLVATSVLLFIQRVTMRSCMRSVFYFNTLFVETRPRKRIRPR